MKRTTILLFTAGLSLSASGCEFVGDVLQFGFFTIVILFLIVIGLLWGGLKMIQGMGRGRDDRTP